MNSECCQQNICFNEHRIGTNRCWLVLRVVVAFILLIAAILKAYQLATTPLLGEGLLHARWFNIFVVEFELFFGIWLIFGLLPRLTWIASIGLFSIFSIVSFYKVISGETSCGCFGSVTVNPWITMTFNFVTLTEKSHLSENEKSVILEPSKWIGKELPLLQFLERTDIDKILTNNQNIVLFRFDCEECKQMIEKIQDKNHYVFIAIPPEQNNVALFSLTEYLTLPDKYEWWIETPIVLTLENGIVKKVVKRN
ncbi:MAG: DoxX family protein [Planctomycetaceae bacterium]|jgi:uncharacterized membrane protein YphA (DoxX/SURF4 family)|nr:DoxX family protein [Planctomycetaceae bacterium]